MAATRVQRAALVIGIGGMVALAMYVLAGKSDSGGRDPFGNDVPQFGEVPEGDPCALKAPAVPAGLSTTYALGWDNGVVSPISRAQARRLDRAGRPYVAILHGGESVRAIVQIAWASGRIYVRTLDDDGRAAAVAAFHLDDDESVFLYRHRVGGHLAERTSEDNVRHTITYMRNGYCKREADDGGLQELLLQGPGRPTLVKPAFGDWHDMLALAGVGRPDLSGTTGTPKLPVSANGTPWTPGHPLTEGDLTTMFSPGHEAAENGERVRIEVVDAGEIELATGKLLATDPSYLNRELAEWEGPLTATVPPGKYPVELSKAVQANDGSARIAAARITISDKPVTSWELGLRKGQHVSDLGDGRFYGFGVDSGIASFTDASAASDVAAAADRVGAGIDADFETVGNDQLVMWHAGYGDGSYPVWVGRDADGEVAQFVADMLILDGPDDLTAGP